MSIQEWGRDVQRQAYEIWDSNVELRESSDGVQPFTSPLQPDVPLMIMGYNPGTYRGSRDRPELMQQFEKGVFDLPSERDYVAGGQDYREAELIRETIFRNHDILTESIETNRYYLRTSTIGEHDTLRNEAPEYIDFCRDKTAELIERADPDTILAFGMRTHKSLRDDDRYDEYNIIREQSRLQGDGSRTLFLEATLDGRQVLIFTHPSPKNLPRLIEKEKELIAEFVRGAMDI
ncbi:hypothetical protein [Haloarcula halophila]|uniref:hypothetical protein n=1 Tax=Halomicroarcula sp. GCM10025335 TaxID=3252668 RepID=UPI00361A59F6